MAASPNHAPSQDAQRALGTALQLHRQGKLVSAEKSYRNALRLAPSHPDALHLLGVLLCQSGRNKEGLKLIKGAIKRSPKAAGYHNSLANALAEDGQLDQAERYYRSALKLDPGLCETHSSLCHLLCKRDRLDQAIQHGLKAVKLKDDNPDAHNNLGNALEKRSDHEQAKRHFQRALALRPDFPAALSNLGRLYMLAGATAAAEQHLLRALALSADSPDILTNLGSLYEQRGEVAEASRYFRRALDLQPEHVPALLGLGNVCKAQGRLGESTDWYREALQLRPNDPEILSNLAVAYWAQGLTGEAVSYLRSALKKRSRSAAMHSNLLFFLNSDPSASATEVFREHLDWGKRYGRATRTLAPVALDPDPDRPLRIGYLSADFRSHPVAAFIAPLLAAHQRSTGFEAYCYASVKNSDSTTEQLRRLATNWRNIAGLSDTDAAESIAADRIDILVELGGHTANSRLLVLAQRPAAIQMTYLGYPNTTGLAAVDYRITDARADPPGLTDRLNSEKLLRLNGSFLCFKRPANGPMPNTLPALERGQLTFGSFNNISKITTDVVELWAAILLQCPGSRLIMKAKGLEDKATADRFQQLFVSRGVELDSLVFCGYLADDNAHLSAYHDIDIALDPFPYNGTTTSCEALWMGIPVISLAGKVHAGRVGASLLTSVGLEHWIADSGDNYLSLAREWQQRLPELANLRATLRKTMELSVLMDENRFIGELERNYRQVWRDRCQSENPTPIP